MLTKRDFDSVRNACKSDRKSLRNGSRNLHNHERSTRVTSGGRSHVPVCGWCRRTHDASNKNNIFIVILLFCNCVVIPKPIEINVTTYYSRRES